jgi:hypothetical protein
VKYNPRVRKDAPVKVVPKVNQLHTLEDVENEVEEMRFLHQIVQDKKAKIMETLAKINSSTDDIDDMVSFRQDVKIASYQQQIVDIDAKECAKFNSVCTEKGKKSSVGYYIGVCRTGKQNYHGKSINVGNITSSHNNSDN